jgi:hypothetical protein
MGSALRLVLRTVAAATLAGAAVLAHAQGFSADYSLNGLSLQGGHNWFGQFGLAQGPVSPLVHSGTNDVMNVGGGYRWSNGQSLSLQLSRGRGQGQRLGLAVNYDWPRYFVRFSYDPPGLTLSPQDSLRFSAGVRF